MDSNLLIVLSRGNEFGVDFFLAYDELYRIADSIQPRYDVDNFVRSNVSDKQRTESMPSQ